MAVKMKAILAVFIFLEIVSGTFGFITGLMSPKSRQSKLLSQATVEKASYLSNSSYSNVLIDNSGGFYGGENNDEDNNPFINFIEITSSMEVDNSLPPIILLHGMFGSSRNLLGLAKSLPHELANPRKVYTVDLRNHGKSEWRNRMSYEDLVNDMRNMMGKENIQKAVFVGHSIGGKIACSLALSNPELVDGLIVMDIAPVEYSLGEDKQWCDVVTSLRALNSLPLATINSKAQADRMLEPVIPDASKRAFCLTQLQPDPITKRLKWKLNIQALENNVDNLASFHVPQLEPSSAYSNGQLSYNQETLFIAGGKSRFLRSKHLPTISNHFPKFSLVTVREAGHWLHVEAPDRIIQLIKAYVERER
mmetsp:Transcript_19797/g.26106  ORF Transcript_19797/g.26106 Transcript_19797/m.26106 type:complete len:364 (-) Transcript_19797:371-1462(-)